MFLGNIYTTKEMKFGAKKIQVMKHMQAPTSKQELNSFLGLVKYLSQFIPTMSDLTSYLWKLLKNKILFHG